MNLARPTVDLRWRARFLEAFSSLKLHITLGTIAALAIGIGLRVGASMGVASLTEHMQSTEAWVAEADAACYRAKADGRGAVRSAMPPLLRVVGGRTSAGG